MTTLTSAPADAPSTGRLMRTPQIEPLTVDPADRCRTWSRSSHRAAERMPTARRCAGSCRRRSAPRRGPTTRGLDEPHLSRDVGLGHEPVARAARTWASATVTRSAIIARTRPEWTIADLASLALGAVTCPIYPQSEPGQAAFVINNVEAKAIFVENAQQANKIAAIRDQVPTLEHVITLESSGKFPDGTLTLEDVIARADTEPANRLAWREGISAIGRDHLATVIHTSGTTGNPKGAMLSHGNVLFNFEAANQVVDFYPTDVFLTSCRSATSTAASSTRSWRSEGRGRRVRRGAHRAAAGQHGRGPADGDGVGPAPVRAGLRARQSAVEAGSPTKQRIFHWATGLGAQKYANHLAGKRRLAVAQGAAQDRRCAGVQEDPGPDRRPRPLLRLRLRATGARDRRVLLRHGHARAGGLRPDRDVARS